MADKTVRVLLQAVTSGYERDMRRAAGTTQTFGARQADVEFGAKRMRDRLATVGATAAGMFGGLLADRALGAVVGGFNDAADAALDLEQAVGATQAVFGNYSGVISRAATDSADAVGLSERAFRESTASIGAQLQRMTGDVGFAADQSMHLVEVGADLAATFGGTTEQAVHALGRAFAGEADPAEKFALNLKVGTVQAYAAENGLGAVEQGTDNYARALVGLIDEQTAATGAVGQFAREADTGAGKIQRLQAELEDLQAAQGEAALTGKVWIESFKVGGWEGLAALTEGLRGNKVATANWGAQVTNEVAQLLSLNGLFGTLSSESEKARAALDRQGATMTELRGANEHAARASGDLAEQIDRTGGAASMTADQVGELVKAQSAVVAGIAGWSDPMATYNDLLEQRAEKEKAAAEATAAATKRSSDSWEDYAADTEASFVTYMDALGKHSRDQREWHRNINEVRRKAGDWYADLLLAQGPEYAALHAQIADQEATEVRKARDREKRIRRDAAAAQLNALIRSGSLQVSATGKYSQEMVDALADELGVTPKMIRRILNDDKDVLVERLKAMKGVASDGGGNIVDAMGNKLEGGKKKITRIVNQYGRLLQEGLNPVIASVGGKTIVFRDVHAARFAGRYTPRAMGGIDRLPMRHAADMAPHLRRPVRIAGEAGDEAYIPLANDARRPRARMIAHETVRRLGGDVQWFAKGGFSSLSDVPKVPRDRTPSGLFGRAADATMAHARREAIEWLEKNLAPQLGPGIGYQAMWRALHGRFPNAQLISGFRPGAITATGNRSYHGMGRAIDVSPWASIAQWIRDNYMAKTREMIFSPFGSRQIHNGRNHYYSGITRAMHWDHVHWAMRMGGIVADRVAKELEPLTGAPRGAGADLDLLPFGKYDQGGALPPGLSVAYNGLGRPEPVGAAGNVQVDVFVGNEPVDARVDVRLDDRVRRGHREARQGKR